MESKTRLLGHPLHPMLIVFPAGLFIMAVVCDILYLITGNGVLSTVAFYDISGGILGGLIAAIIGFRDYLALPLGTRAKRVAMNHGVGNLIVLVLFALSWLMRLNYAFYTPPALGLIFSFAGIILIGVTAWLGGELVDRLGVGVDPGANLNATSSLSDQPASAAPQMNVSAIPVTGDEEHDVIDEP